MADLRLSDLGAVPMVRERSLLEKLGQTWPARLVQSAYEAVKLPGDVYAGRVDPMSDHGIGRAADLAGLVMGGGFPMAERGALGMAGGRMLKSGVDTPKELYHVVGPEYEAGQPLRSLYARKGNAAYDEFAQRWPESQELSTVHPHQIFFYDDIADAVSHSQDFGGKVFKVDPQKVEGLFIDQSEKQWKNGKMTPGYWATSSDVPPDALSPFATTK